MSLIDDDELDAALGGRGSKARSSGGRDNRKSHLSNPMLAHKLEIAEFPKLRFPVMISPKLDGIRATDQLAELLSRRLKKIPNRHTQARFGLPEYEGLDGELIVGDPTAPDVFNVTESAVMSHDGFPDTRWFVFDTLPARPGEPFIERHGRAAELVEKFDNLALVSHEMVKDLDGMLALEDKFLDMGYEGICGRDPAGPYKHGRSTLIKEGWLWKFKRFEDAEAKIVGFEELRRNENAAEIDERGYTSRARKKEFFVPGGTLGKFIVVDVNGPFPGVEFKVGTGLTAAMRDAYWANRAGLVGKLIKYGYTPKGMKDKPRFPKFLGFRSKIDL